jgi:hypothetical protein
MQFSSFSKSQEGLTITLYNITPIENVISIKYYSDNSSGTFTKKEFRWSFDNVYWSSWEVLTQAAISRIDTHGNCYLFLQIRYVLTAIDAGTVSTFALNYVAGDAVITPTNIHQDIETPDTSAVLIHDVIQSYHITEITNAETLNGYLGSWYLNRANHYGTQPISSITNLQSIINNLISAAGVTYEYVDGSLAARDVFINQLFVENDNQDASITYLFNNKQDLILDGTYLKEASIGLGFAWHGGMLDVSAQGDVTKLYVDGSLYLRDLSINNLYQNINTINVSLGNYVKKTGDTMSGGLYINASLNVTGNTFLGNTLSDVHTIFGDFNINGNLTATTKSFLINHPTKSGLKLQYGNLEGAEYGIYVRGKYNSSVIQLPDYWPSLIDESTITVNLTSTQKWSIPYVKEIRDNRIYLGKLGIGKFEGFYIVFAERKDVKKLIVEK